MRKFRREHFDPDEFGEESYFDLVGFPEPPH